MVMRLSYAILLVMGFAAMTGWAEEEEAVESSESASSEDSSASTNVVPLSIDGENQGLQQAPAGPEPHQEHSRKWDIRWDHGLYYSLEQKILLNTYMPWKPTRVERRLEGRLGIRIHTDAATYSESGGIEHIRGNAELRRGRLYTLGNTYYIRPLDYRLEFGFAGTDFFFNEGYLRWNEVPWIQSIQVGQFKAPMSLEMMGSSGSTTFMERGSPVLAFAPGSRLGVQIGGPFIRERTTLMIGGFANVASLDVGDASDNAVGPIGRFTMCPLYKEQDGLTQLLHLGVSASHIDSRDNALRYQSRPESFIAPFLVDTEDITLDRATLYGLEAAGGAGPLVIQGEFLQTFAEGGEEENLTFEGMYTYVGWFLTGENRPYNENRGIFSRVRPRQPLSLKKKQWGAWEVAARASIVDLSDGMVRGGRMKNVTGGLNWYWSQDCRMMFNYIFSKIDQKIESGDLHILQARLQLEF